MNVDGVKIKELLLELALDKCTGWISKLSLWMGWLADNVFD